MEAKSNHNLLISNILYSCVDSKQRESEQYIQEYSLGFIVSGEVHFETASETLVYRAGTIGLARKNQLVRSLKVPPPGGEFRAINIFLNKDTLRKYGAAHHIKAENDPNGMITTLKQKAFFELDDDPIIRGFFNSLIPYFDLPDKLTEPLIQLKTNEAIELLLQRNNLLKDILFDFSDLYKIDIQEFMDKNYKFNVSTERFAQLTGRSIAGFKRDFEKTFRMSPGRWLHKKRLEEAYYQIKQQGRKPSDVYQDVGFENLSHFSYAFKKTYGISPSLLGAKA
ncbi:AraC family transcriptional regulator [Pedobacter sp. L105]|uniref:helix-turn-helix domain-containing protein n=1 Tax=Pedobacter sp. L105 TaxID=1641871 RepID=UPI00131D16E9|nr:AraC family transcriptional regulator [Pedobacter sp. L105]